MFEQQRTDEDKTPWRLALSKLKAFLAKAVSRHSKVASFLVTGFSNTEDVEHTIVSALT